MGDESEIDILMALVWVLTSATTVVRRLTTQPVLVISMLVSSPTRPSTSSRPRGALAVSTMGAAKAEATRAVMEKRLNFILRD
jgi:hypothetical protein